MMPIKRKSFLDGGIPRRLVEAYMNQYNAKHPVPIDYDEAHKRLQWKAEVSVKNPPPVYTQEELDSKGESYSDDEEYARMKGDDHTDKHGGWR